MPTYNGRNIPDNWRANFQDRTGYTRYRDGGTRGGGGGGFIYIKDDPKPEDKQTSSGGGGGGGHSPVHYGGGGGGSSGADWYRRAIKAQEEMFEKLDEYYKPYRDLGTNSLDEFENASTAQGLADRLKEIMGGDVYGNLMDERTQAARGQLASAGLSRSGAAVQEMADLSTATGLDIESILYGRLGNNVQTGLNATHGTAGVGQNAANQISGTYNQQGNNDFQQMLAEMGFAFQANESAMNRDFTANQNALQLAQQQDQFQQSLAHQSSINSSNNNSDLLGSLIGGAALYFSDRRLKKNIVKIGETKHLNIYQWEWVENAPKFIKESPTSGFLADEVNKKFPEHIYFEGAYMKVDYDAIREVA